MIVDAPDCGMTFTPLVGAGGQGRTGKGMWAVSLLLASTNRLRSGREMVKLASCLSRNWVREFLLYFTYSISPDVYDKPHEFAAIISVL